MKSVTRCTPMGDTPTHCPECGAWLTDYGDDPQDGEKLLFCSSDPDDLCSYGLVATVKVSEACEDTDTPPLNNPSQ